MSEDLTFVPCGQKSEKIAKNGVFSEIGSAPPSRKRLAKKLAGNSEYQMWCG